MYLRLLFQAMLAAVNLGFGEVLFRRVALVESVGRVLVDGVFENGAVRVRALKMIESQAEMEKRSFGGRRKLESTEDACTNMLWLIKGI